ncbi:MAG TPA: endonuclease domain-containing protein [Rubricoccaceae bacterium]|jgi:very-short-patch-repair endonuclease|nr:endonuclease domain-containing protein [Rubricoccaceae bacterium]
MRRTVHDLPQHTPTRRHLRTHGTPAEAALWTLLRNRQLHGRRFRRQHSVGPYVLDFYCPAEKLAVELDGAVHFTPERAAYDAERTRALEALGIRVLRFENRMVFEDPEAVLGAIAACFSEHGT